MFETTWLRSLGWDILVEITRGTWEAPKRHPEAPRRHLGGTQEARGILGGHMCYSAKVKTGYLSRDHLAEITWRDETGIFQNPARPPRPSPPTPAHHCPPPSPPCPPARPPPPGEDVHQKASASCYNRPPLGPEGGGMERGCPWGSTGGYRGVGILEVAVP